MQPQRLTYEIIKQAIAARLKGDTPYYIGDNVLLSIDNSHLLSNNFIGNHPFMLQYTLVGLVRNGNAVFTINFQKNTVKAGNMIVLNSDTIYEVNSCSDDFVFDVCIMSDTLPTILFPDNRPQLLDRLSDSVLELWPEQIELCSQLMTSIIRLCHASEHGERFSYDVLRAMLRYLDSIHRAIEERTQKNMSRDQELFHKFLKLVNANAARERNIDYYAEQLYISRNYLSIIVSRVSGTPAKDWIERAVVMEAKALLRFTSMSVLEISDKLNFPNDSFFNKYFKRNVGCTPVQYRKQQEK